MDLLPKDRLSSRDVNDRDGKFEPLVYHDILVERQICNLVDQAHLVYAQVQPITHTHFATSVRLMSLTPEGEMLVRWTVADF